MHTTEIHPRSLSHKLAGRLLPAMLIAALLALPFLAAGQPAAAALPSDAAGQLEQCHNGTAASPAACAGAAWSASNGDVTSVYWKETDSVPYRVIFTDLAAGAHTAKIAYVYTQNQLHVTDYLTSFDLSAPGADACTGVAGVSCSAPSTLAVPAMPTLATCVTPQHNAAHPGVPQEPGNFTLYGGTLTSAAYAEGYPCQALNQTITINLVFDMPTAGSAVLAWGGHVASEFDWGNGQTVHDVLGQNYAMMLTELDGVPVSGQARTFDTAAVYTTDLYTDIQLPPTLTIGQPLHDRATLTGYQGETVITDPVIAGTLNFYYCYVFAETPPNSNGCDPGAPATLVNPEPIAVNGNGEYESPNITINRNGYYCFRAEFTPAAGSVFPPGLETNPKDGATHNQCVIIKDPTSVGVERFTARGNAGLLAFGGLAAALVLLGAVIVLRRRA